MANISLSNSTEIPGYSYVGDVNIADYGGKWIGITRENCGHVIEVIGAADLEDGDAKGAIILSAQMYVSGHTAMRRALESCGWVSTPARFGKALTREQRRVTMLEAYHGYYGADTHQDFGGPFENRVTTDADAVAQANSWAQ